MISGVTKGTITFLQIPLSILIIFFTVWSLGTKVESKLYTGAVLAGQVPIVIIYSIFI